MPDIAVTLARKDGVSTDDVQLVVELVSEGSLLQIQRPPGAM